MPKAKAKVAGRGNVALTAELLSKTRLCVFHSRGLCTRGSTCTFAHGVGELAARPDFSRTQVCRPFKTTGQCAKGDACPFAHALDDLRRWGRCEPDEGSPSPTGPEVRGLLGRLPDGLRGDYHCASTEGTASTSGTTVGSESEAAEASRIALSIHAVHMWQVRDRVEDIAGPPGLTRSRVQDIAEPPGLTACAQHRNYHNYNAAQERLDHGAFKEKVDPRDEDRLCPAQEFLQPPPQPPPPPRRWLGELAAERQRALRLQEPQAVTCRPPGVF